MARSQAQVLDELLALSPPGWALSHDAGSVWASFLQPVAAEWSRVEASAEALLDEIDPRTSANCLADYQRVLGPDPYGRDAASLNLTHSQLVQLAYQRWTASGGCSIADYVALAAQMGVAITITERKLFRCGASVCGDTLACTPQQFVWLVTLPQTQVTKFRTGASRCGEPLGLITPSPVVPLLQGEAPAHTTPVFSYTR
jgi:uncharacterized protein YmfQ (DUF2313 family)